MESVSSSLVGLHILFLLTLSDSFHSLSAAADVLLWRNKKISVGVLASATAIWILFEWLNYNFLPLICFALVIGMLAQFVWTNASGLLNR